MNDINAIRNMNAVPDGYRVNDFVTDTQGWMLITDCPDGLKYFQRDPLEIDMYTDGRLNG